jgi:hypothetical protein
MRTLALIPVIIICALLVACEPEMALYEESKFSSRKVDASFVLIRPPDTSIIADSMTIDTAHHYHYSIKPLINYQLRLKVCCSEAPSSTPQLTPHLTPEQLAQAGFHYLWKNPQGRTSFNNNYTFQVSDLNAQEKLDFWLSDTLGDSLHFEFHLRVDTSFVYVPLTQGDGL